MDTKLKLAEYSEKDGKATIRHVQNALPIFQSNDEMKKDSRNINLAKVGMFHVARVPVATYLKMQRLGILGEVKETIRILNKYPENKVTLKRI